MIVAILACVLLVAQSASVAGRVHLLTYISLHYNVCASCSSIIVHAPFFGM